jgi:hypothetical protein
MPLSEAFTDHSFNFSALLILDLLPISLSCLDALRSVDDFNSSLNFFYILHFIIFIIFSKISVDSYYKDVHYLVNHLLGCNIFT